MKTILVLTDFSNNAYCALFYVAKLFESEPSHFILLNSVEDQVSMLTSLIDLNKSEEEIEKLFKVSELACKTLQRKLISDIEPTEHTFNIITTSFLLTRAINEIIKSENVDFVVMGSKGKTATDKIFIGSNSFSAIKAVKEVPLLIIPDKLEYKKPKKIGLASSLKREYSKKQIQLLKEISKLFNAKTAVIYVYKDENLNDTQLANLHNLLEISKDEDFDLSWVPETHSKAEIIMDYVHQEQLDMLAICYHKHSFISTLFREHLVKEIAYQIRTPLLILPNID